MTALLALLAVAGYQNRDKIAEMLGGAGRGAGGPPDEAGQRGGAQAATAGAPGGLGGMLGGAGVGGMLGGGLKDLVERFRQAGYGETAESWVNHGPNRELAPGQLEQVIDPQTLEAIARQTGLPREEIIARLTRELPSAVDKYTPDGKLPS